MAVEIKKVLPSLGFEVLDVLGLQQDKHLCLSCSIRKSFITDETFEKTLPHNKTLVCTGAAYLPHQE